MKLILRALGRGALKRCPRCGAGGLFRSYFTMLEECPSCGLRFEREEGYWVGALIVNAAATSVAFVVVLLGGLFIFWPEVPWIGLTIAAAAVNLVVPVLFYPWSKTIWMGIDRAMTSPERRDRPGPGGGSGSRA